METHEVVLASGQTLDYDQLLLDYRRHGRQGPHSGCSSARLVSMPASGCGEVCFGDSNKKAADIVCGGWFGTVAALASNLPGGWHPADVVSGCRIWM